MNYYTLASEMPTNKAAASLNGRIFFGKRDRENNHARFFDAFTGKEIMETTRVLDEIRTENGVTIRTRNTTYELINIMSLIPTHPTECDPEPAPEPMTIAAAMVGIAHQITKDHQ